MSAASATAASAGKPTGQIRGTGKVMILWIVTLGIYGLIWYYKTHNELKAHTGEGLGGGIALLLALFVGIVMPFVTGSEVGKLYQRDGQEPPVTGKTGFWILLPIIGLFIWISKVQSALNRYWESKGATA